MCSFVIIVLTVFPHASVLCGYTTTLDKGKHYLTKIQKLLLQTYRFTNWFVHKTNVFPPQHVLHEPRVLNAMSKIKIWRKSFRLPFERYPVRYKCKQTYATTKYLIIPLLTWYACWPSDLILSLTLKLGRFQSQLQASYVSSYTEEL